MTESGCNPLTQARGFTENYALNLDWSKRHSAGGKGWNDQTICERRHHLSHLPHAEIVERRCSHVGIIHRGHLVAQGSLEELRAGVEAQAALVRDAATADVSPHEKLTLEQIFLRIVGGSRAANQELSWLG